MNQSEPFIPFNEKKYAIFGIVSGSITYVAKAVVGASTANSVWQVMKMNETSGFPIITWADGNENFDNVATDLTALSFS